MSPKVCLTVTADRRGCYKEEVPASDPSLWGDTVPAEMRAQYDPLDGDTDVDVAIVGAGFTGLWTAYYLAVADPALRISVVERERVGFGASGRNGGWCSALLPMGLATIAARHGSSQAVRFQREMHHTVDEVGRVAAAEEIDCHYTKGGTVSLARSAPQAARLRAELDEHRRFGFGDDDHRWLDPDEVATHVAASDVLGASYTPHCAAIHPARLVHGLAGAAGRRGVTIHEGTAVERVEPRRAITANGVVRAEVVVRATEAYTVQLPGHHRDVIPLYSLMIATEPLAPHTWEAIGLAGRATFHDDRHMIIYGQRTVDGRLAFGGRGAPYHFGSTIRADFDTDQRVRARLTAGLRDLLPALPPDTRITHHWGGPLAVPRDWQCSVTFDRSTGLAHAGGYVGDGVATTNLAGRTLAALITGASGADELTSLPWVGHRSRRWEPEPLRWLGTNLVRTAAGRADAVEDRAGRESRIWGSVMRVLARR